MTSNVTKLKDLRDYLDTLIWKYQTAINSAIREMEKFNVTPKDFREESVNLNVAAYTLSYLSRAKEVSGRFGYKTTENFIRFHKHQLEIKASGEPDAITLAQNATISALSTIIDLFFDK